VQAEIDAQPGRAAAGRRTQSCHVGRAEAADLVETEAQRRGTAAKVAVTIETGGDSQRGGKLQLHHPYRLAGCRKSRNATRGLGEVQVKAWPQPVVQRTQRRDFSHGGAQSRS